VSQDAHHPLVPQDLSQSGEQSYYVLVCAIATRLSFSSLARPQRLSSVLDIFTTLMPPKEETFPSNACVEQLHEKVVHEVEEYALSIARREGKVPSKSESKDTPIAGGDSGGSKNTEADAGQWGDDAEKSEETFQSEGCLESKLGGENEKRKE
jgi:hypothetical protein